jgi:hypothetical protein
VENCFPIGTVNFTAGVIKSQTAQYITPRVIEAKVDTPIEKDNWVIESLYILPEVMTRVSLSNLSQLQHGTTWMAMSETSFAYHMGPANIPVQ